MTVKYRLGLASVLGIMAASASTAPGTAQVVYQPYLPVAPTPYGFPVPYGYLQPDEVLGTSPSFVVSTNPYAPGVGVVPRCQYPDGWNVTDFSRDFNGIPNGIEHECPVSPRRVRARY